MNGIWEKRSPEDYVCSVWSDGTTTQLLIAPEGAHYAARDFLWRVSSATVELDESDFTPLPARHQYSGQSQVTSPFLPIRSERSSISLIL